jgi:hypothetical protein
MTDKFYFSVLGNHDYRGDALAQLSPVMRKIDSRFICMRSFIVNSGTKKCCFQTKKGYKLAEL